MILGLYWGYIGIMEKENGFDHMVYWGYIGLKDNRKDDGNYYLGFRAESHSGSQEGQVCYGLHEHELQPSQ